MRRSLMALVLAGAALASTLGVVAAAPAQAALPTPIHHFPICLWSPTGWVCYS